MRRIVSLVLTVASVIAAAVVAVALAGGAHGGTHHAAAQRRVVATLPGSVQIVRYQRFAGGASCTGTSCSGSGWSGPEFTLPASSAGYHAALTVSFRYRASGAGATFVVTPSVSPASGGHPLAVLPAHRSLIGTGGLPQSMTVVFRPTLLSGAIRYSLNVEPDIAHYLTSASISVSQVVYSLTAWRS
jgi:hypothetical protein